MTAGMDGWMDGGSFQCVQQRYILIAHNMNIPFGRIAESDMLRLNLPPTFANVWLRVAVVCECFRISHVFVCRFRLPVRWPSLQYLQLLI